MKKDCMIFNVADLFKSFFQIKAFTLSHTTPEGSMSPMINREVMIRDPAAAILAYDPDLDKVLVIKEFRIGRLAAGLKGNDCWSLGPIAGMVGKDEEPTLCALRELKEEAGLLFDENSKLIGPLSVFPSPGGCSEIVHLYILYMPLDKDLLKPTGLAEEGEYTEPMLFDRSAILRELFDNPCPVNGHLSTLLLWLETIRKDHDPLDAILAETENEKSARIKKNRLWLETIKSETQQ